VGGRHTEVSPVYGTFLGLGIIFLQKEPLARYKPARCINIPQISRKAGRHNGLLAFGIQFSIIKHQVTECLYPYIEPAVVDVKIRGVVRRRF